MTNRETSSSLAAGTWHLVDQGESIESLADVAGVPVATIWDHPDNARLRDGGRSPNVLKPGDMVFIPNVRERIERRATEARHQFICKGLGSRLHVRFLEDDTPRANAGYSLTVDEGPPVRGTTDGSGYIDHRIGPQARLARLRFDSDPEDAEFELRLGHLDPVTTASGVQQRLRNLDLFWGDETDQLDDETRRAITAFQRLRELDPTGELDDSTRAALIEAHGS